ncbi:ATP-binding protein [Oligoflexus tunisiensis]|uniref:ATP-binding protein n=1 Tax=Oligoflexus tunisiensis TaxID=708132 RepID=UPI00114D3458|nr:ATP-binding protein [Oligoflexus tunisiensis]
MTRKDMETLLLTDPFNLQLRLDLANLYVAEKLYREASAQYSIILSQNKAHTEALEGMRNCQAQLETERGSAGLEAPLNPEEGHVPGRLALVQGHEENGNRSNVVSLHQVAKKESVKFSDIVGMQALKDTLRLKVIEPFKNPGLFAKFSKKRGDGILLYGPPGCGKTMFAKAIAHECDLEFISVDISDILSMYIGGSENNLARVFERARSSKPCVLFFDELDALAISRSKVQSHHSRTLVNELLNQMDGVGKSNEDILILGATNMPWDIDAAAKRPGRFSRLIFVPPLDQAARRELFRLKLHVIPTEKDINLDHLAQSSEGFSGADIDGLIEAAKERALLDMIRKNSERAITMSDLLAAMDEVTPSCHDWMRTAENLVKFGGVGSGYKDLARYLRA